MSKNVDLTSREWCDLVFVGKNQAYGAYAVRVSTPRRFAMAVVVVAIALSLVIFLPGLVKQIAPEKEQELENKDMVQVTDLDLEAEEEVVEEEVEVVYQEEKPEEVQNSVKFTAPVITADEEVDTTRIANTVDELLEDERTVGTVDVSDGTDDVTAEIAHEELFEEPVIVEEKPEAVLDFVEQMPTFPGGEKALMKHIGDKLKYPEIALTQGIQGRVVLRFVVEKDGSVGDVVVARGLDPSCDKEAVRVVKSLPKFIPGRQNGNPVRVWFTLPITFKLM